MGGSFGFPDGVSRSSLQVCGLLIAASVIAESQILKIFFYLAVSDSSDSLLYVDL
jgi:hypothetical protein